MDPVISRIEDLARTDPIAAPLAVLTAESLRRAGTAVWKGFASTVDSGNLLEGKPLLTASTIEVNSAVARELLSALAVLACSGVSGTAVKIGTLPEPLDLMEASINQDTGRLSHLALETGTDVGVINTLGQLLALPVLRACGEKAGPALREAAWTEGYCPVCAAWPTLAEVRGTERERWLRCGRCGSEWRWPHLTCVFCRNDDHSTQSYLAPESSIEALRTSICEQCHGYLKNVSTLMPLEPSEVLLKDLSTLEFDAAAIDRGYGRPDVPGGGLGVKVQPQ